MTGEDLAAINDKIAGAQAANDPLAEGTAHEEKSLYFVVANQLDDALAELVTAERCYFKADDLQRRARANYGRGMLLARMPGQAEEAHLAYRKSAAQADIAKDDLTFFKAIQAQATLYTQSNQLDDALATVSGPLWRAVERRENKRGMVDVKRHEAQLRIALGKHNRALASLEEALELAKELASPELQLLIRLERRNLLPFTADVIDGLDSWDAIIAEASILDREDLAGHAQLQLAGEKLRRDDYIGGAAAAEAARQTALASNQPVLYLMACMLIAEAREFLNDRPGVLEILLTCKVTLERNFGPEMAAGVPSVLDSLTERWGKEEMHKQRLIYRERMAAKAN